MHTTRSVFRAASCGFDGSSRPERVSVKPKALPVPVKWSLASTCRLVAVKSPLAPESSVTVPVIERVVPESLALPEPVKHPAILTLKVAAGGFA